MYHEHDKTLEEYYKRLSIHETAREFAEYGIVTMNYGEDELVDTWFINNSDKYWQRKLAYENYEGESRFFHGWINITELLRNYVPDSEEQKKEIVDMAWKIVKNNFFKKERELNNIKEKRDKEQKEKEELAQLIADKVVEKLKGE